MTDAGPSSNPCRIGPARLGVGLAAVCLGLAVAGRSVGDAWGAKGPTLYHVGLPVGLAVGVVAGILHVLGGRLRARDPERLPLLRRVWRALRRGALLLVAAALATEVIERLEAPLPQPLWLRGALRVGQKFPHGWDVDLGWSGSPGATYTRHVDGQAVELRNNSHGFVDVEPVKDARPRLLVVGDSFAWGSGVTTEEALTGRLREAFPDCQVLNQACQAYHLDQILLSYRREGRPWKPKVVVLSYITVIKSYESRCMAVGQPKPWCVERNGELVMLGQPVPVLGASEADRVRYCDEQEFLRVTTTAEAVDFLWRGWLTRESSLFQSVQASLARRFGSAMDPIAARLVAQLAREVRADGGELIVVTAPADYLLDLKNPRRALAKTVELLASTGVDVVELSTLTERPLTELYLEGTNRHPNAAGHALIAEALVPRIQALLESDQQGD